MSNETSCWLCLRITPEKVLKWAHKVWPNPQIARKMGLEASKIIEQAYREKPPLLCGKKPSCLVGSLFYVLGLRHAPSLEDPAYLQTVRTHRRIAEGMDCTESLLQARWRIWFNYFPSLFPDSEKIGMRARKRKWAKKPRLAERDVNE